MADDEHIDSDTVFGAKSGRVGADPSQLVKKAGEVQ